MTPKSEMLPAISALRDRPIPNLAAQRLAKEGYREMPIDSRATRASEPLLALETFGVKGRNYYAHRRNPPYWRIADGSIDALYARHGVGARLQAVNKRLSAAGMRLHVFDAWRPRAVQAYFYETWLPGELRRRRPDLQDAALMAEVERYWARPTRDSSAPAPHATGAAIDLTILWEDGEAPFMGSLFDDASAISNTDHFETIAHADWSFSAEEARANRRVLYWVMTEAGFANQPDEWWHYSWGDQMWAKLTGAPSAFYGLTPPPPGAAA